MQQSFYLLITASWKVGILCSNLALAVTNAGEIQYIYEICHFWNSKIIFARVKLLIITLCCFDSILPPCSMNSCIIGSQKVFSHIINVGIQNSTDLDYFAQVMSQNILRNWYYIKDHVGFRFNYRLAVL